MSKNNIQPSLINGISPNNVRLPQRPCWDGWITPGRLQGSHSDKLQCAMTGCFAWKALAHGAPSAPSPAPSEACAQRRGQTARLMGVWDNAWLPKAPQGRGRRPRTPSSPLPGQEGMPKPNRAAARQGELGGRQHHASVTPLWAAPQLAHPPPARLSLTGTPSYSPAVSGRKILLFRPS